MSRVFEARVLVEGRGGDSGRPGTWWMEFMRNRRAGPEYLMD